MNHKWQHVNANNTKITFAWKWYETNALIVIMASNKPLSCFYNAYLTCRSTALWCGLSASPTLNPTTFSTGALYLPHIQSLITTVYRAPHLPHTPFIITTFSKGMLPTSYSFYHYYCLQEHPTSIIYHLSLLLSIWTPHLPHIQYIINTVYRGTSPTSYTIYHYYCL